MLKVTTIGLAEARAKLQGLGRQLPFISSTALNATAFDARAAVIAEMNSSFDRPTPFITKGVTVRKATKAQLWAEVYADFGGPGGKSVSPERVLQAEVYGGPRRSKRAEVALQRVGLMLPGHIMVPAAAAPLDAYGNVPGSFLVRLLAYFQAFGEQGYRANMTDRNKAKLSGRGRWVNGRFVPATSKAYDATKGEKAMRRGGVEYFISRGRGERNGKQQHLPAGIWQRKGVHGEDVTPVFLFVDQRGYSQRLAFQSVARSTAVRQFPARYLEAQARALATAR